jgi:hypothetical protein
MAVTSTTLQVYRYVSENTVIYVGMGKPGRAEHHFKGCFWRKRTPFYNKLQKLIRTSTPVEVEIIWECESREEAAAKEREFIDLYGRRHLGGLLWNLAVGGEGCSLDGDALKKRNAAIKEALTTSPAVHARRKPPKPKKGQRRPTKEERQMLSIRMRQNNPMSQGSVIEKMRASKIGKTASQETKAKMSVSHVGRKQSIVTCPHCDISGGAATMPRWHFSNCKEKDK